MICKYVPRHSGSLKVHCKRSQRPETIIVLTERERERERERRRERESERERGRE